MQLDTYVLTALKCLSLLPVDQNFGCESMQCLRSSCTCKKSKYGRDEIQKHYTSKIFICMNLI